MNRDNERGIDLDFDDFNPDATPTVVPSEEDMATLRHAVREGLRHTCDTINLTLDHYDKPTRAFICDQLGIPWVEEWLAVHDRLQELDLEDVAAALGGIDPTQTS